MLGFLGKETKTALCLGLWPSLNFCSCAANRGVAQQLACCALKHQTGTRFASLLVIADYLTYFSSFLFLFIYMSMFLVASKMWVWISLFQSRLVFHCLSFNCLAVLTRKCCRGRGKRSTVLPLNHNRREHLALKGRDSYYLNKLYPFPKSHS